MICPQISESPSMFSKERFISQAIELGFCKVGFCMPDCFDAAKQIVDSQETLSERKQLRFSPKDDHPEVRSIAVLLWPYLPAQKPDDGCVFVDSYYAASNAAYHAARALETRVQAEGCFAKANVSYPAKTAALRAGMGVIGKNSLLITPEWGSRVVIILMATGIELPSAEISSTCSGTCFACGRCSHACPAGAITNDGMTHPERCLRNYMMEGVVVPEHLRAKIGMRMIGCDICQRVCPMQPHTEVHDGRRYLLDDFMAEDDSAFSCAVAALASEIGRNSARPQRVRAQAALLAGNSKNPRFLPILHQWAQSPFDAVCVHAKWAIQQIEQ